jgi:hypothetical protein
MMGTVEETRVALAKELQSLLAVAGLPEERELIGRKFAFTYNTTRISGTILGIKIRKEWSGCYFSLITTHLQLCSDDEQARIYFNSPMWNISFTSRGPGATFFGEFELL